MKRRLFLGGAILVVGVIGAIEAVGCNGSFDICEGSACTGVDDGGNDADGQIVPPGCDLTKDPKDSIACVDDSIGLFVSGNGSDSNAGTKASPLKSIGAALAKVSSQRNRVYVCDGTYGESVKVTTPVGIYGAFACTDWSYDNTQGKVGPTGAGYALDIEGVSGTVTVEDLEFDAQNGANPGDSSIAVFVASSTVTLKRVKAVAGNGATGADAIATSNYEVDAGGAPVGNSVDAGDIGAGPCINTCVNGQKSTGGGGGNGGAGGGAGGQDGGPAIPPAPSPVDNGLGGIYSGACTTGTGSPGATAVSADAGAVGAALSGHATASGWSSAAGGIGQTAGPGQGGGGGAGGLSTLSKGGGGGGGCGGCGGAGGVGGSSGGSSFAVVAYQAALALDTCALQAGTAGDGKAGGQGQIGESGGNYGNQFLPGGVGCQGGPGGNGGDGAGGGGGAGGNAIAIGYVGTKPTVTGGTMTEGTAGAPGGGGTGAAGNNGLAGAAGTKADMQELP